MKNLSFILLSLGLLYGCGGGSGETSTPSPAPSPAPAPAPAPAPPPQEGSREVSIDGVVAAGLAQCDITLVDQRGDIIVSGNSNVSGEYSLSFTGPEESVYHVEASKCSYVDEYSGERFEGAALSAPLLVPQNDEDFSRTIVVTPITELLLQKLSAQNLDFDALALEQAIEAFSQLWFDNESDFLALKPLMADDAASQAGPKAQIMHGLLLANISALGPLDFALQRLSTEIDSNEYKISDAGKNYMLDAALKFEQSGRNRSGLIATTSLGPIMSEQTIQGIAPKVVEGRESYEIQTQAGSSFDLDLTEFFEDEDSDNLLFVVSDLPEGISLLRRTRLFGEFAQAGAFTVIVTAFDNTGGSVATRLSFDISAAPIQPGPTPPEPTPPGPTPPGPTPPEPTPPEPTPPAPTPPEPTPPEPVSTILLNVAEDEAVEGSGKAGRFTLSRTGSAEALRVAYSINAGLLTGETASSGNDYVLVYQDSGEQLSNEIAFLAGQTSRTIELRPVPDSANEVPETFEISLNASQTYELGDVTTAKIQIIDNEDTAENRRVFLGLFAPQSSVSTEAQGSISLVLNGSNSAATVNYTIASLSSEQTNQHIQAKPSDIVVTQLPESGGIENYQWDLAPGGLFTNKQQLLDALFDGQLYLNIRTQSFPLGEVSAPIVFNADAQAPNDDSLNAQEIDNDIIRFLTQSTFGPTEADYMALRSRIDAQGLNRMQVYEQWIDEQISLPQTSFRDITVDMVEAFNSPQNGRNQDRRDAFWHLAVYGNDQLRQRMAFALSQILVISDDVQVLRNAHIGVTDYWDTLGENAFLSYRKTLEDVTRHPVMGQWLSHLRNNKEDPDKGTFPDENYAREVMQLFSFGLVQLEKNGELKLNGNNLPIPTYDNETISQMARVFTGLSFSKLSENGAMVDNERFNLSSFNTNDEQYRWTEPMKFFPDYHEWGEKTLFTDSGETLSIAAASSQTEADADAELATVLDAMTAHSSTAPYISRLLIQRFVTSNPSPDYIERVATAFGQNGDLRATIKAILLDPEARNPKAAELASFGKVKEPLIQLTSLLRLMNAGSKMPLGAGENGFNLDSASQYPARATMLRINPYGIDQEALRSPTVFNFFSPDYAAPGPLAQNGLVAPELEVLTEASMYDHKNFINDLIQGGVVRRSAINNADYSLDLLRVELSFTRLDEIWERAQGDATAKATALVDYFDFYMNAGYGARYETEHRDILIEAVAETNDSLRNRLVTYGSYNSPEFVVQK